MVRFIDTHAHIHFADYGLDANEVWRTSKDASVDRMIAVGCRLEDSKGAVDFARSHEGVWASVGIHPHEAREFLAMTDGRARFEALLGDPQKDKIVAIGETGLDYYYEHSNKQEQRELLEWQLGLAKQYDLPLALHVRDAFDDFWPIFDQFEGMRGVVHSFSASQEVLEQVLSRGLYVGLNGIMTFTKDADQLESAKAVPLNRLLLETDAPYLTPKPYRGKICKPEHIVVIAEFLAELRNESLKEIAKNTSANAYTLFGIK